MVKELKLKGKYGSDELEIEVRGKFIYFTAIVDQTGDTFRILKEKLINYIWVV